jgi:hypothetical protein
MERMNRGLEEFNSATDPRFLALLQASTHTVSELTEENIKQEWEREIKGIKYSVFGIVVNDRIDRTDRIEYFGSERNEDKQRISSLDGGGLAKEILKTLEGRDVDGLKLSIDQVNNELVIAIPEEPAIRIPEKGEPYSN